MCPLYYVTEPRSIILGLRVEGTVHNFNISPIYTIVSGRLLRSRNVPLKISYILKPKIPYSTSKRDRRTGTDDTIGNRTL